MPAFFLNHPPPPQSSPLPPHAPLPICRPGSASPRRSRSPPWRWRSTSPASPGGDRKSTRLNSSHGYISYARFFFKSPAPPPVLPSSPTRPPPDLPAGVGLAEAESLASLAVEEYLARVAGRRSEEHTSELQSRLHLVCPLFF